ncbi:hypothetical protein ACJMK2_043249 [Sinanodonta woodiana]|uniref:EXPERA domain-containing protein n=1 Tax=Sinanodonta woodiana TaxID=1069815 RepID=A0ABD3VXP2_SINWO
MFPPWISVFLTSLLAVPLIYAVDKLSLAREPLWILIIGVVSLLIVGLVCYFVTAGSQRKVDPVIYVFSFCTFSSCVDLFVGLEADGFVSGFMGFYFREGEPYLKTPYASLISWLDGTLHYVLCIAAIYQYVHGKSYRELGLLWAGSIGHSMLVFMPGNLLGISMVKWSVFLNVPWMVLPFYAAVKLLTDGERNNSQRNILTRKTAWQLILESFFAVWFIGAILLAYFRGIAVLGSKLDVFREYIMHVEPYLMDTNQYGKMQAIVYMFHFLPVYVACLYALYCPVQTWVSDLSILHAGAAINAQFGYIGSAIHPRTPQEFRIPMTSSSVWFWLINLSLLLVPQLFALYCNYGKNKTLSVMKKSGKKIS